MHTTSQKKASKNLKKFKVKGNVTTTAHGQISNTQCTWNK
nr:hypothetical protein MACL_00001040 [Theileria orientalis]